MNIKRHDHFPFYIYPQAKSWISFEDTIITFIDWLIDAHEQERNKSDVHRSFYQRCVYVSSNFLRYQNDTLGNLMFDTKIKKNEYDKLNSTIRQRNIAYYLSLTGFHTLGFMYLSYFFRFRRLNLVSTLVISSAYYYFFTKVNNIAYKLIVDKKVIDVTRKLGYE